jgi:FHS family glucose/mannose:H+ symporter-like MFS transporter
MNARTANPQIETARHGALAAPGARKALAGFFVSGLLLAFLGAILPAWGQHVQPEDWLISLYFIALIAGLLAPVRAADALVRKKGLAWTLTLACGTAAAALLYLAFFSPPFTGWFRLPGVFVMGCAAGLLHTAIFQAISPMYRHDPAATVNLAGILFGLGCAGVAFVVSRTFYIYTASAIQIWIALIPAVFAVLYARSRFAPPPEAAPDRTPAASRSRAILAGLKSPVAIMFSLVLFFQFGNEWVLAGWLPLFLIQRLGMSPAAAVGVLALYWLALLIGRVAAQWVLPRVRHGRLLSASLFGSMFAYMVLLLTNNRFGAVTGVMLLGASFAPVYPLVVEKIGRRFPFYHPGFYNGIFSFAIGGGLLAPCLTGYLTWLFDVGAVVVLPLLGSIIVSILLLLIWLESYLSGRLGKAAS